MVLRALSKPIATRAGYLAKVKKSNTSYLLKELKATPYSTVLNCYIPDLTETSLSLCCLDNSSVALPSFNFPSIP